MEIILQSQDKHDLIGVLDWPTGSISVYSSADRPELSTTSRHGYFAIQDGAVACFFRLHEKLYFTLNRQTVEFQEHDKIVMQPLRAGFQLFSILRDESIILSWEYKRPEILPPISAFQILQPMTSEEDFDLFVFVHNVMNDPGRRNRVFRGAAM